MIPGKKIVAMFGFCDIRNFTDTTEVLQEEIMIFVNTIAKIVHNTVDSFNGSANKNVGDAFLVVWKFGENKLQPLEDESLKVMDRFIVEQVADLSVLAFIKIIVQVRINEKIDEYNKRKKLLQRMPGYAVKLGFGLHVGWAIEGAIGSSYKIDASYLSPHVNIAAWLEETTKIYGVPFLVSGDVGKLLSRKMKKKMRVIDRVVIKGGSPMEVLTFDLNTDKLKIVHGKLQVFGRE